jgi:hypothetical protein
VGRPRAVATSPRRSQHHASVPRGGTFGVWVDLDVELGTRHWSVSATRFAVLCVSLACGGDGGRSGAGSDEAVAKPGTVAPPPPAATPPPRRIVDAGCVPDQHDLVLLTADGTRRSKYAEELARSSGDAGFNLTALGCDATMLGVSVMSYDGGDVVTCDDKRLGAMIAQLGDKLRKQGFTSLWCDPDGPEVSLR